MIIKKIPPLLVCSLHHSAGPPEPCVIYTPTHKEEQRRGEERRGEERRREERRGAERRGEDEKFTEALVLLLLGISNTCGNGSMAGRLPSTS